MSEKQQKPGSPEDGNPKPKSPKGFGGVVLILALLLALFVVVSSSGMDGDDSEDAFLRRLFRGQVVSTTWAEGVVSAEYRVPPKDGKEVPNRHMEVVLREFPKDDVTRYFHPLAGKPMDTQYQGADGLARLYRDVVTGKIEVTDALFVQEVPGAGAKKNPDPEADPLERSAYVVVFAQIGNEIVHLFSEPKGGDQEIAVPLLDDSGAPVLVDGQEQTRTVAVNLQVLRKELTSRSTPIRDWTLSLSSDSFQVKEPNTALIYVLSSVVPWILVLLIVWFFILRQMRSPGGGGGVLSFGRSRAALYTKENRTNITFDDVAGMEEAKNEVKEIIEFLKNPAKFAKLGGSIPRGVLLVGSPGTGKTLLAKAIAGEAEVPFFSISGSDFVEMFVGVGASRVRDLFKQAREASPCIVFLDEIDAVGRKRGTGMGGGHDEREQTLNAILVEMDGFDSDKGIILLGATNRPDVLDPALLRPGRFDRQVVIDMPDVKGREAILKVHARKVKLAPTVDLTVVARATAGFSGAELAAVINEGAILAAMKGKDSVNLADLEEARDRVRWGREKRSRAIEEEDKKVTAFHEAGHALVSVLLGDQDPIHKVTIVSRGRSLGATLSLPEKDDYNHWRKKLLGRIAVCFGGRIAEDVVFGDVSAGAQNDIEQASKLARVMVCELGMSDKVGPIKYTMDQEANYLGSEMRMAADISPKTMEVIDGEVRRFIDEAYDHAKTLIVDNRAMLDCIAEALMKHETISGDEISILLRGDDLDEFRAAQARREAEAHREAEAASQRKEEDKPDVDLSGAEGLAHP